jgi:hypothetical protein
MCGTVLFALVQHFELAACIGEVYAALGSEEVSLAEGMLARMHQTFDPATVPRGKLEAAAECMKSEVHSEGGQESQDLASQVRYVCHIRQHAFHWSEKNITCFYSAMGSV